MGEIEQMRPDQRLTGLPPAAPAGPAWLEQIQFRLLKMEDLPALEWEGEFVHFRRLYRETFRSAALGKSLMWVADLLEKGLIGQVFVQLNSGRRELADGGQRAYIYGFRIKPPYRNVGVGGRLLETVEGDLIVRRFRIATLNVARDNPDACRFYERHGYRVAAAEPGYWAYLDDQNVRHEVHEPAWRMEKKLK